MNHILRKVSVVRQAVVLNQALTSCRATPSIQDPVWCAASVNERQYRSMPTHGIGRWKHLLTKRPPRKKKGPIQMRPILPATSQAYGTLNVKVSGYDMTLVEHYYQYVHNLCIRLGIKVAYSYALPTKSTEVMLMQEQSSKMYIDSVLKTHERVVQVSRLKATTCPIFIEVLLKNQPEGVRLSVTEHTEADFHARFKVRPQLQELRAQITSKAPL